MEEQPLPIADASIDLGKDARYHGTGRPQDGRGRVTLRPGTGAYAINGRDLDTFFPRATRSCSATSASRSRRSATRRAWTSWPRSTAAASPRRRAPAPRHLPRPARGRSEPARRAQAARVPHARRAREGTQEGRPEEGAQAAAVLEALARAVAVRGPQALRNRWRSRRSRARRSRPSWRWRWHGPRPPAARRAPAGRDPARHARVGRDAGGRHGRRCRRGGRGRPARRGAADAGHAAAHRPLRLRPGVVLSASHNPYADNGIKFFGGDGDKLSDATEEPSRSAWSPRRPRVPRSGARAAQRCAGGLPARAHAALPRPRPERPRRACSTAPTAPPTAPRRRRSGAWARGSPRSRTPRTGAISTPAAAPRTWTRSPRPWSRAGTPSVRLRDGDGDRVLAVDGTAASSTATS